MKPASPPLRSFLFAPGNHARRVANALSLNADSIILDLEDAVATAEKPAARAFSKAASDGENTTTSPRRMGAPYGSASSFLAGGMGRSGDIFAF